MTVACIVIAKGQRATLIDEVILPKAYAVGFYEILIVGEHHEGDGYRYVHVPALTQTTNDALIKRDVGALAAYSDVLWYLSDDHYPACSQLTQIQPSPGWDVVVPRRWTIREGKSIPLDNGERGCYCAGHGMIVQKDVIQRFPWCGGPFDRCWDVLISRRWLQNGVRFLAGVPGVDIFDVEPGATPWL